MKEIFNRVFPVILIYLALGFVAAAFVSLSENAGSAVLPPFEFAFNMQGIFIRFVEFYPALATGGLLAGFAIAFRTLETAPKKAARKHSKPLSVRRNALVFSLALVGAYVILAEGAVPVLKSRQSNAIAKTDLYNDYMLVYRMENAAGNLRAALSNAEAALSIWEESPEAERAAESARIRVAEFYGESFTEEENAAFALSAFPESGYTAPELMERAQAAAANIDFYNAHYYASLSWRAVSDESPYREASLRLASESWNRITESLDGIRAEPERRYYERKLKGYSYIQAGDFLSAYYYFLDMQRDEQAAGAGTDPDIARFLEIARQGVVGAFFFADETENLAIFEQAGAVFFTLPNSAGGKDAVLAGGVSRIGGGEKDSAYFRNFELARFDSNNRLSFHIATPYAKMLPLAATDGSEKSQLILTSVNKSNSGARRGAEVVAGSYPPSDSLSDSVLILDMPYEDISLLIDSSSDTDLMTIPELLAFSRQAERYGFHSYPYLLEFVQRVSSPFIVFAVAVLALAWAWKLRLRGNRPFAAWWLVPMPLIPVACAYIIAALRHAVGACIALFSVRAPMSAIPCAAVLVVLLLFAVSFYFFAQGKE